MLCENKKLWKNMYASKVENKNSEKNQSERAENRIRQTNNKPKLDIMHSHPLQRKLSLDVFKIDSINKLSTNKILGMLTSNK
ncbi:hypothetical protein HZS_4824 [Henneguya salminicola]|nr:hypothetical protein HZS_4824 [Henneguya salminicola]